RGPLVRPLLRPVFTAVRAGHMGDCAAAVEFCATAEPGGFPLWPDGRPCGGGRGCPMRRPPRAPWATRDVPDGRDGIQRVWSAAGSTPRLRGRQGQGKGTTVFQLQGVEVRRAGIPVVRDLSVCVGSPGTLLLVGSGGA